MMNDIKLILASVRQYKKYAIITPLFMVLEVIMECLLPFIMSVLVDTIENITSVSDLTTLYNYDKLGIKVSVLGLIIVLIGAACISLTSGVLGGRTAARASVGLSTNLRSDLYKKIQSFSFGNIDKFSTSSLVTRMTTDINNVQMAFQLLIRIVIRAPLMMIFSATMAFVSGGQLAWVFIGLVLLVGLGLFFIIKGAMTIFRRVFKRYDKLNESVQENVSGIRVVKTFVREFFEKEKFNKASDDMTFDFVKAEKIVALNNPIMNTTIHLSNIIVIALGSWIIATTVLGVEQVIEDGQVKYIIQYGNLTIGQMSALLTYGIQILTSVMMISMILVMLVMSIEAIRRIAEVLKEESTIVNPENPLYALDDGSVVFNNVNFKYVDAAEKNTLENINISIKSGEFVGILGTTGSGKTSIINLISRLYDVSDGEVIVGKHNVKEYDLKTLRDNVAVVLQKNVLFSGTIKDNLRWGDLKASDEELKRACQIAQADEFINQFPDGYDTRIEQGGSNVSGGQKQRLCIARAILKKPQIMILDDSTSAVDTKTDRLIRKGLKEDLPHMTKIVIAQRISSIEDADKIIMVNNGTIAAIGNHQELMKTNASYRNIYLAQNKNGGDE